MLVIIMTSEYLIFEIYEILVISIFFFKKNN